MKPCGAKILAKPTVDISLEEHTSHVVSEAQAILASRPFVKRKYHEFTGKDLEKRVLTAAKYHDLGKQHPRWQDACRKDYEIYQLTKQEAKMYHLRKANFRHEIASLLVPRLRDLSEVVKVAIGAHHNKLSEDAAHRWEDPSQGGAELWRLFKGIKNRVSLAGAPSVQKFERAIFARYEFAGPRSFLQLADHRASALEGGHVLPSLKAFKYEFPSGWSKRGVQRIIEELKDNPFSVLRAPTGSGKTDAALLWAQHQIDSRKADRLVIAMPTRFTANALAINTAQTLSQTGLYHSTAWFQRVRQGEQIPTKARIAIQKEQELARLLETPITVTTIDHLCICLTGTREDHHAIFFNLAHSCVVIDEADFYDEFTELSILVLLRVARLLRVPVLLMSATVPSSRKEFYGQSGFTLNQIHEDKTDADRDRYAINRHGKVAKPNDCDKLLEIGFSDPLIIYVNTVARAQAFYRWYLERDKQFTENNVVLYHSRFTEPHKANIESILRQRLGSEAWQATTQRGVAILTQIGELSVNISADVMVSDICPLDRLAQRAGRLARFGKHVGTLHVIEPFKEDRVGDLVFYPAPYGHFRNRKWEMSKPLQLSREWLSDGRYSAKSLFDLVDKVYASPRPSLDESAILNAKELENLMVSNWLILPADRLDEDDDETATWKSRDIEPQYTVYADFDLFEGEQFFPNYSALREFQIFHGVQCYAHEFHNAREKGYIEQRTFIIGEQSEVRLCLVRPSFYDSRIGLHFDAVPE